MSLPSSIAPTICAIATAPGRGGVGIVRVSGPLSRNIARQATGIELKERHAHLCSVITKNKQELDQGIALFFKGPHSFTGEDVFEFQGHGGPVVLDLIVKRFIELGATLAKPGEFSERAFLNDKIDLTQAEAIADLINASSVQAAQNALHSLKGEFAQHIDKLVEELTHLRLYVESAIDFPEEEIDFLVDGVVTEKLKAIVEQTLRVFKLAEQGSLMREGMKVVLAGKPNAGKSTLLNALAERDVAIVTDIEGTTRDALTEHIHINGMPLHITDTAGIRETENEVERIGIERAWRAIHDSDQILLLADARELESERALLQLQKEWPDFFLEPELKSKLTIVINKIDLANKKSNDSKLNFGNTDKENTDDLNLLFISAKSRQGLPELKDYLLKTMGLSHSTEGAFSARRRHLDALNSALDHLREAQNQLELHVAGELVAEDLRLAQNALGEITGKIHPDELLGKIFSSFCIGK